MSNFDYQGKVVGLNPGMPVVLQEFTAKLTSNESFEKLIAWLLEQACQLLQADVTTLVLWENNVIAAVYSSQVDAEHSYEWLENGICGQVARHGRIIHTPEYQKDIRFEQSSPVNEYLLTRGIVAVLAAPVEPGGKPAGVLEVDKASAYEWNAQEEAMAVQVTNLICLALHQKRQQHEFQRELSFIRSNREDLWKQKEQLITLLELSRTALHELSQPLTVLQVETELITELGEVPDQQILEDMAHAVTRMMETVRAYQRQRREVLEAAGTSLEALLTSP